MRNKKRIGLLFIPMALAALFGLAACGEPGGNENKHVHNMTYHEATATCTSAGEIEYWSCSTCGKNFSDEAGAQEVTDLSVSVARGHDYNANNQCRRCGELWKYSDGVEYNLNEDKNSYSVIGAGTASGDIVLPYYYEGKPVTSIDGWAFEDCGVMTGFVIPDSITSIGNSAFSGCSSLTSIVIPDSVTSIGNSAFIGCSSLTSIVIPDRVTNIEHDVFANCSGLTSVTIGSGVTSIDDFTFFGCNRLTSIVIPDSVTSIDDFTFFGCNRLTSIVIPDSVTSIDGYAFANCSRLTSIFIPDSVTSINDCAFYNCIGLTSIVIPDSMTSIGNYAFEGCGGLTIYCEAESKPDGWKDYWNMSNRPVVWGYRGEE